MHDPKNPARSWYDVRVGDHKYIAEHSAGKTLMLIWPPEGNSMAYDSLRNHRGERFIFIGLKSDDTWERARSRRFISSPTSAISI